MNERGPMKLGKHAPKKNLKTLLFSKYLRAEAPPPPPNKVFREYKISDWKLFGNDSAGDCTCAAAAHMLMLTSSHTGRMIVPELEDVIGMYTAISGYDPATGANDDGAAITDVLDYWQTTGLAGHKILGWAKIDHTSLVERHQGIYIFGANDIGVQLPTNAQDQFSAVETWDVAEKDGGIEGGHCILEPGYGREGSSFVTWGANQKASNEWSAKYVDEAYVVIDKSWINEASGLAPNSLDLDTLRKDLASLRA